MTKEELKEAIAATITENGKKGITGHALANILNEIVDAAGEGGGGGVENVFTLTLKQDLATGDFLFSEPNEANALIRQKIVENIANEVSCTLYLGLQKVEGDFTVVVSAPVEMYGYMEGMVVLLPEGIGSECLLNEDGSFTTEMPEQTSGE